MYLDPLVFLATGVAFALIALAGSATAVRSAWRGRMTPMRAAAIADQRADLKGRLATVYALAPNLPNSSLWPYLIEDTYGARNSFEPSRIEPRWLSQSVYALLAALVLAAVLLPRVIAERLGGGAITAQGGSPDAITADINDLDIRPADPALAPNAEIYADAATLQRLQERMAQEQAAGGGALSKLMDRARSLAGALQGKIDGRPSGPQPPVRMHLTDRGSANGSGAPGSNKPPGNQAKTDGGGADTGNNPPGSNQPPPMEASSPPDDELAGKSGSQQGMNPADSKGADGDSSVASGSAQGASHGSGSDPSDLFGDPSAQRLGNDSFKIAIDAEPSDEASGPGTPGYLPPKVRVAINPQQYPDEPLARALVPPADQMTIKRVFER